MRYAWPQDLLALELVSGHRNSDTPDRLQVHRKGTPGQEEEEPLAHELHCVPNTNQVGYKSCVDHSNLRIGIATGSNAAIAEFIHETMSQGHMANHFVFL